MTRLYIYKTTTTISIHPKLALNSDPNVIPTEENLQQLSSVFGEKLKGRGGKGLDWMSIPRNNVTFISFHSWNQCSGTCCLLLLSITHCDSFFNNLPQEKNHFISHKFSVVLHLQNGPPTAWNGLKTCVRESGSWCGSFICTKTSFLWGLLCSCRYTLGGLKWRCN